MHFFTYAAERSNANINRVVDYGFIAYKCEGIW